MNLADGAKTLLNRLLNLSSDVRPEETTRTTLLLINIFLLLVAYYVIKTVREPLILASGGAEMKSYAAGFQAALLAGFVPLYGWVRARVSRMWLNTTIVVFYLVCIELFFGFGWLGAPNVFGLLAAGDGGAVGWLANNINLGFVFYIWVGIFSVSTIAQFWSYANDLFDEETGSRLFPVIAVGATAGAPVGSAIAGRLFDAGIGPYAMLQISAVLLAVHLGIYYAVEARIDRDETDERRETDPSDEATPDSENGFRLILENRYLWWIALFLILLNLVNTTGEYILGDFVESAAHAAVDAGRAQSAEAYIGAFYGDFYSIVNVVTVVIQAFFVSRIIKYIGMKGVIFALPVVSLGTYGLVALGAGLPVFRWAKTAENSTDYSVMNTTRALVWLPTTEAEQYSAKQTIDTFFVRVGDVLSAGLVFAGTTWLNFRSHHFAYANLVLIALWIGVGILLWKSFWRLSREQGVTMEDIRDQA
ncbi:MAG: NTP/NDP exchange transporter [Bradymonadaceae bacterium]